MNNLPRDVSSIAPSTDADNVIALRPKLGGGIQPPRQPSPFDKLTAQLVLAQFRAGTLPEPLFVALLAGVGLWP